MHNSIVSCFMHVQIVCLSMCMCMFVCPALNGRPFPKRSRKYCTNASCLNCTRCGICCRCGCGFFRRCWSGWRMLWHIYIYTKLCLCIDSHLVDPHTGFIIKFQSQTIVVRPCHNNANKLPGAWQN